MSEQANKLGGLFEPQDCPPMPPVKPARDEQRDRLYRQLVQLGDMMGDGMHHEPGGKWIAAEYRRTMRALGHALPRRNNTEAINRSMTAALKATPCPSCGGALVQTRAGSKRARCGSCQELFQFGRPSKRAKS